LVVQVVAGLVISLAETSIVYTGAEPVHGNSSVAVWIVVFALAVPVRFGKALGAALATASMGPVGLGLQIALGNVPSPPLALWFVLFSSQYLMAGAAALLGRLIYRLGVEVKAAREYGGYQLIARIGGGGMGEVWKARHHLIGREAAVKLIRPELLGGDALAAQRRFEREAKATAGLHSPHTISLYNYGLSEDGLLYYVMELLDGYDLDLLVGRYGPVPAARAVAILTQVCDSLGEAHERGLIHRDVKPGNIVLCPMGASGDFAKVLDFGLAQDTLADGGTSVSGLAGTPDYMAPEVLAGSAADARSDLYGVGCVAYWLLSGRRVFEGATAPLVMQAHLAEQPVPPSTETENRIPAELDALVLACLEKDPARRPQSARELAGLLAACRLEADWRRSDAEAWWADRPVGSGRQG
jgi:serine/threonine-protein kinase